jgi:hypothetical protein
MCSKRNSAHPKMLIKQGVTSRRPETRRAATLREPAIKRQVVPLKPEARRRAGPQRPEAKQAAAPRKPGARRRAGPRKLVAGQAVAFREAAVAAAQAPGDHPPIDKIRSFGARRDFSRLAIARVRDTSHKRSFLRVATAIQVPVAHFRLRPSRAGPACGTGSEF